MTTTAVHQTTAPTEGAPRTDPAGTPAERLRPVFDRIRDGALRREADRTLPHEEIEWLRAAGFGRLRVPVEHGGDGVTLEELFGLVADLAAADSNIPQALRGHIGFTEIVLTHPDAGYRARWLGRIAAGALVGNAESERTGTFGEQATEVTRSGDRLVLNGEKFYTTGSIFADWIFVSAARRDPVTGERGLVTVQVDRRHPGVVVTDDWNGFGQRLTGSGTTVFTDVEVDPQDLHARGTDEFSRTTANAVYQLVHLATLAGLAQAALDEISGFVRSRPRNLFNPGVPFRKDPAALEVVGQTYGAVRTVHAAVLDAARTTDAVTAAVIAGTATEADFAAAEGHVYAVQGTVIDLVLTTISRVFEVGGASATAADRGLDRLWRNARTVASHNPALHRQAAVGDWLLNDVSPASRLLRLLASTPDTDGSPS